MNNAAATIQDTAGSFKIITTKTCGTRYSGRLYSIFDEETGTYSDELGEIEKYETDEDGIEIFQGFLKGAELAKWSRTLRREMD